MNNNTLAGAFATALTSARKPASLITAASSSASKPELIAAPVAIPMQKRKEQGGGWKMEDALLLEVLQQSLTPADKLMARRTLLRPAPWEGRIQ